MGSLEEVDTAFTEPSTTASSLGSWANECERADAALTAAEAQVGRGCTEEILESDAALDGELLMEEDGEWMVALKAALEPGPPRLGETGGQPKGQQGAPKPIQGPPPTKGGQKKLGPALGPQGEGPPPKELLPGRSLTALAAREARKRTRSRW